MKSLRLLSALSLLLLAACVAQPPQFFTATADQTVPPPPAGQAQIVFLHPGGGFIAMLGHVYELNGEQRLEMSRQDQTVGLYGGEW